MDRIKSLSALVVAATVAVVMALAVALIFAIAALFVTGSLSSGFDKPDLSIKDLDEDQARRQLKSDHMVLPKDFTYVRGQLRPVGFVGTPGFALRFDAPAAAFDTLTGSSIGGGMSAFRDVACDASPSTTSAPIGSDRSSLPVLDSRDGGWSQLHSVGYRCDATTRIRYSSWATPPSPNDPIAALGQHAVVLVARHDKTEVYVHDSGS